MLKIFGGGAPDCDGTTRRSFLQAGMLGLGGLALPDLLRLRASGATAPTATATMTAGNERSVILFWLSGGPGHMETWDPKPEAPAGFRGPFGSIATSVPGVRFGELLPEQARLMDRLAILRTVNHGTGDHTKGNHWMLTGYEGPAFNAPDNRIQRRPAMGAAVARLKDSRRPGLPSYVAVPNLRGGTDNLFHYSAYLGGSANPFIVESDPNDAAFQVKNLKLPGGISIKRLEDRRLTLLAMDQLRRDLDPTLRDLDAYYQRAFDMLTGQSVADAFDISAEPAAVRERYGRHSFGQSALMARRLVEAGTPFVTVNCVPWDHHGTAPQLKTEEGAKKLIPPLDRALAALIADLIERGLYESTLVVAMGEFGRTPRMNKDAGRDHWGNTFSVLMGCGSMRMGQVIGRSSQRGEHVVDRPISPQDVAATVYHHLGIDARAVTFEDRTGRPTYLIENGDPIRELLV
ncbi:Protein of unknown function [Singulisphaera sp. GP187]|uniref:DUF1501 domain-containing protein n=1 Tax=Singulisphaera sp. GP187 TaxID=1882752 RepID=UPI00092C9FD5|nr:DUF1501 domain-containing protein [Singulisphaera sp. GP187]SIO58196.1 Protein of unknown function [Singulisphaera sp. GP187]